MKFWLNSIKQNISKSQKLLSFTTPFLNVMCKCNCMSSFFFFLSFCIRLHARMLVYVWLRRKKLGFDKQFYFIFETLIDVCWSIAYKSRGLVILMHLAAFRVLEVSEQPRQEVSTLMPFAKCPEKKRPSVKYSTEKVRKINFHDCLHSENHWNTLGRSLTDSRLVPIPIAEVYIIFMVSVYISVLSQKIESLHRNFQLKKVLWKIYFSCGWIAKSSSMLQFELLGTTGAPFKEKAFFRLLVAPPYGL